MAGATLPDKTDLCENCYKSALPNEPWSWWRLKI